METTPTQQPKKSQKCTVQIVLTDDLVKQVDAEAQRQTTSRSDLVRSAIRFYLKTAAPEVA
jgi:metal-responsive CopG/Arc/MetJ family transcriptional regulator